MSCVRLSEGGFQVVYPLGLWSRSSGVVKVLKKKKKKKQIGYIWIWLVNYLHIRLLEAHKDLHLRSGVRSAQSVPATGVLMCLWTLLCSRTFIHACMTGREQYQCHMYLPHPLG